MKPLNQNVKIRAQYQMQKHKKPGMKLRTGIKAGAWDTAPYGDKPY